jgi:AraC-like DNA-binding protein
MSLSFRANSKPHRPAGMSPIPLTSSFGLGPFRQMCAEAGDGVLRRILRAEGAPEALVRPGAWVPVATMCSLFDRAAREVGDDLFGLRLGERMQPEDFGPAVRFALRAATLSAMIPRSNRALQRHTPGASSAVEVRGGAAVWKFRPSTEPCRLNRHHADHVTWSLKRMVERFLGAEFKPLWIEVGYAKPSNHRRLEEALGVRMAFESASASVGVAFPTDFLSSPSSPKSELPSDQTVLREFLALRPPGSTSGTVREFFLFGDEDHDRGIASLAKLLQTSPRSLQRMLQAEGTSFRELLASARYDEARKLLATSDMSVADIALYLGYEFAPNFIRAFGNRARMAPMEFRAKARSKR